MVWPCPLCFEGLLAIGIDLVLVDAVKVFGKGVQSSGIISDQDLEGCNLVEVKSTVVAGRNMRVNRKPVTRLVGIQTL